MIRLYESENGGALLISLCLMAMLTMVAIVAVNTSNTDIELSYNMAHADEAFYLAEAGANHGLIELNLDNNWRSGFQNETFGRGVYSLTVIDSISDSLLADTVILRATGRVLQAEGKVELWTTPVYRYPFVHGLFGDKGIALDRNTCSDSFNSDSGSYAATRLDEQGSLGSNGTITTSKDINIGGDVSVATPGGITLGPNVTVAGDTSSTADSVTLDAIPDAEFAWAQGASVASSGISGVNYTYNAGTKALTLGSTGEVTLSGGVYHFSAITVGSFSQIKIASGASVTIYVTGDVIFNQGSSMNDNGSPADLVIYSKGSALRFDQDNTFFGAFYGPNAHIQYDQTTQVYGSLVGGSIKLDNGACFHYDRQLGNIRKGTTGEMVAVAWKEN